MEEVLSAHKQEYGATAEIHVSVPGVATILGEHTDFQNGLSLQAAFGQRTHVAVSRRKDTGLRFFSSTFGERKRTTIANLKYKREDRWANYPKGSLYEIMQLGYDFRGLDITLGGDTPQGIGLGSSAAVCLATAVAVDALYGFGIPALQLIQAAALAESAFIGTWNEMTDGMTGYFAKSGKLNLVDMKSLDVQPVGIDLDEVAILLTNSNVPVIRDSEEESLKRNACNECLEALKARKNGSSLRDFDVDEIKTSLSGVQEASRRYCLHIMEENLRVEESLAALQKRNYDYFGKMMNRSHESLRDNYEISCPELDWLVKRAWEIEGVYGSKMTGPGFGGCTITLLDRGALDEYESRLEDYERIFGFKAQTMLLEPASGYVVH